MGAEDAIGVGDGSRDGATTCGIGITVGDCNGDWGPAWRKALPRRIGRDGGADSGVAQAGVGMVASVARMAIKTTKCDFIAAGCWCGRRRWVSGEEFGWDVGMARLCGRRRGSVGRRKESGEQGGELGEGGGLYICNE